MKTYIVYIRETVSIPVSVEANSPEEAIEGIREGAGIYGNSEHIETLSPDTWRIGHET